MPVKDGCQSRQGQVIPASEALQEVRREDNDVRTLLVGCELGRAIPVFR